MMMQHWARAARASLELCYVTSRGVTMLHRTLSALQQQQQQQQGGLLEQALHALVAAESRVREAVECGSGFIDAMSLHQILTLLVRSIRAVIRGSALDTCLREEELWV
jgi:hypothetical protein